MMSNFHARHRVVSDHLKTYFGNLGLFVPIGSNGIFFKSHGCNVQDFLANLLL